jgi:hypothetical protein
MQKLETKKKKEIKNQLDKSQTLKKRLRQKRASRWTENPKGRSMQKLETCKKKSDKKNVFILIG